MFNFMIPKMVFKFFRSQHVCFGPWLWPVDRYRYRYRYQYFPICKRGASFCDWLIWPSYVPAPVPVFKHGYCFLANYMSVRVHSATESLFGNAAKLSKQKLVLILSTTVSALIMRLIKLQGDNKNSKLLIWYGIPYIKSTLLHIS